MNRRIGLPAIDSYSCDLCHKTYTGDYRGAAGSVTCTSCGIEFQGPADSRNHYCPGKRAFLGHQQNQ